MNWVKVIWVCLSPFLKKIFLCNWSTAGSLHYKWLLCCKKHFDNIYGSFEWEVVLSNHLQPTLKHFCPGLSGLLFSQGQYSHSISRTLKVVSQWHMVRNPSHDAPQDMQGADPLQQIAPSAKNNNNNKDYALNLTTNPKAGVKHATYCQHVMYPLILRNYFLKIKAP